MVDDPGRGDLAVVGYFGEGNFGDDMLAERMLTFLTRHVPPQRILVSSATRYLERWFPGVRCVPMERLMGTRPRKVILGGGGLLFAFPSANPVSLWGLRNASAFWYWHRLGWRLWQRSHAYAFCLGVGRIEGSGARWATRRFLAPVEHISVRDAGSARLLADLGIPNATVVTDPVCSFASVPLERAVPRRRAVGLVVRAWEYSGQPKAMLKNLLEAARLLRRRQWEVEFLAFHPEDDRDAIQALESEGEKVRCWRPEIETVEDFREHLAQFRVIASMRAHGILMAALDGAAPIGICIEPKLRIFAQRWAGESALLETECSTQAIVDCIVGADASGPPLIDWQQETGLLEKEYARLLDWILH